MQEVVVEVDVGELLIPETGLVVLKLKLVKLEIVVLMDMVMLVVMGLATLATPTLVVEVVVLVQLAKMVQEAPAQIVQSAMVELEKLMIIVLVLMFITLEVVEGVITKVLQ
tara:strand:- start:201 stop:533 length:333 start_codon:yes stop_codon:yes gene_type:complete